MLPIRKSSHNGLAVSNIAWPRSLDDEAFTCLNKIGIQAIEVAPTRVWPEWNGASPASAAAHLAEWATRGVSVSSLQAILFAKTETLLFGDQASQDRLLTHLDFCASLAAAFGAGPLVFGAPRSRLKGGIPYEVALERAADLFRRAAPSFESRGVTLCIEANPVAYGCDFVVNASQAAALVRMIHHPGVRLHLDTACMFLAGDEIADTVHAYADILSHFHVSEPQLGDFSAPVIPHEDAAEALRRIGYTGWITLEMRATPTPLEGLFAAAVYLSELYGPARAKAATSAQ